MKNLLLIIFVCILTYNCNSSKKVSNVSNDTSNEMQQDTVKIVNEELEYEIIIIDPGFNNWLLTRARPRGYHEQTYLESRNIVLVTEWNARVLQPNQYNPNLYEFQINYDPNIDYGYEVNYLLYNYFLYFQLKYNQRLSYFVPRI